MGFSWRFCGSCPKIIQKPRIQSCLLPKGLGLWARPKSLVFDQRPRSLGARRPRPSPGARKDLGLRSKTKVFRGAPKDLEYPMISNGLLPKDLGLCAPPKTLVFGAKTKVFGRAQRPRSLGSSKVQTISAQPGKQSVHSETTVVPRKVRGKSFPLTLLYSKVKRNRSGTRTGSRKQLWYQSCFAPTRLDSNRWANNQCTTIKQSVHNVQTISAQRACLVTICRPVGRSC